MLLGADDERDLHLMVVGDRGQVIQAIAIRTLNDVVLLAGPFDSHFAADEILQDELPLARHQQANDALSACCLEAFSIGVRFSAPSPAVDERAARLLSFFAFKLQ